MKYWKVFCRSSVPRQDLVGRARDPTGSTTITVWSVIGHRISNLTMCSTSSHQCCGGVSARLLVLTIYGAKNQFLTPLYKYSSSDVRGRSHACQVDAVMTALRAQIAQTGLTNWLVGNKWIPLLIRPGTEKKKHRKIWAVAVLGGKMKIRCHSVHHNKVTIIISNYHNYHSPCRASPHHRPLWIVVIKHSWCRPFGGDIAYSFQFGLNSTRLFDWNTDILQSSTSHERSLSSFVRGI